MTLILRIKNCQLNIIKFLHSQVDLRISQVLVSYHKLKLHVEFLIHAQFTSHFFHSITSQSTLLFTSQFPS